MRNERFSRDMTPEDAEKFLKDQVDEILGYRDSEGNIYPDAEGNKRDIYELRIQDLYPFPNHPYGIRKDAEYYHNLKSDIAERGVRVPITVIKREDDDGYYIVSGHTRVEASRELGIRTIPAIIRDYDMDEAAIDMVQTNIYRDDVRPMEKARAYKIMNDAMKHQGKKLCATVAQTEAEMSSGGLCATVAQSTDPKWTKDVLARSVGESSRTYMNYIKLNDLIPKFQDAVDSGRIGLRTGLQIASLSGEKQNDIVFALAQLHMLDEKYTGQFFNEDTAKDLRALSDSDDWCAGGIRDIISPPKMQKAKPVRWKPDMKSISREFPSTVSIDEYNDIIIKALRQYYTTGPRIATDENGKTFDENLREAVEKGYL